MKLVAPSTKSRGGCEALPVMREGSGGEVSEKKICNADVEELDVCLFCSDLSLMHLISKCSFLCKKF